ncbi:hypothetical protein Y032_0088g2162 [Ancylostoma ceylanicum]|uniref:Uncharacterized protein n=1 Tax=Ancylostoma ceylanicum TaxID=53326 RepID=A0A016TNM1_9BILA|nr:hypothetical protein Y032_0088g2162 [Ancylostoma ceylanicum]
MLPGPKEQVGQRLLRYRSHSSPSSCQTCTKHHACRGAVDICEELKQELSPSKKGKKTEDIGLFLYSINK